MRRAAVITAAVAMTIAAVSAASATSSTSYTHGYDVSWPQCSGRSPHHLPRQAASYVVLGLTHGRGHTANPCLSGQLAWARDHGMPAGAYLVPSYPTAAQLRAASAGPWGRCAGDRSCRLRTDGARQAHDALAVMSRAGLHAPMVWVDVEFRHIQPWSGSDVANRHVLEGVFRGLRDARLRYGVYTTGYMWRHIVGRWTVRVPNWLPTGTGDPADARAMCRRSATGGPTWLAQYTRTWDENLTCPVMNATRGRPGPLWRYRHTTLQLGDTGDAVRALQKALDISITGTYELQTATAVLQFQRDEQLPMTGQVDSDDWRALGAFRRVGGHPFLLWRMVAR